MTQQRLADLLLAGVVVLSAVLVSANYLTQPASLRSVSYQQKELSQAPSEALSGEAGSGVTAYENTLKEALLSVSVDINTASYEELVALPGIGDVLAKRILAERDVALFSSMEDLTRVKGIGFKTVDKLLPYAHVGS